jgi:hypothetical protein
MKTYTLKNTYKPEKDYPCDFPIDLVILWCDDTPEFRAKRIYWQNKLGLQQDKHIIPERFETIDELRYLLRSVEMYAPWINHIFIVTDNQKPKWLNPKNEKVTIFDHTEMMPANTLPTFNSVALEAYLYQIPNLSEHFLYANDDTMFSRPVKPQDFFDKNGNPIVRLRADFPFCGNNHAKQVLHSYDVFEQKQNIKIARRYHSHHNVDAYCKSYYIDTFNMFKEEFKRTGKHRFREDTDIQRIIVSIVDVVKKRALLKILDKDNTDSDVLWNDNCCRRTDAPARTALVCANQPTKGIHAYLQYHYPYQSSFEIQQKTKATYKLFGFIPLLSVEEM